MTAEHPLVAIAVPSGDMVHADFALALAGLCHASGALDVVIFSNKSSIVAEARNNGVAMAQDAGADHVLFLDSDMIFPRTALRRLLDHGLDIVGATYAKRVPPFQALGTALPQQPADAPPGLIEMARIPTGCLLIRMTVFDRLSKPYFHFGVDAARGLIVGEDYMFCDRARAAGLRIWCDGILSRALGHIGQQVRRLED
jgi:glycosyltransferase involved in cell wall biosynthesis